MVAFITNLKIVLFSLMLLNTSLVVLFKNPLRLVKGPLALFCFLTVACLSYRFIFHPVINQQIQKEKQTEIKKQGWEYINDPEVDAAFIKRQQTNNLISSALFRIAGLQTVFAFILAAVGLFITPDKKLYSLYAVGFLILAFLFLR